MDADNKKAKDRTARLLLFLGSGAARLIGAIAATLAGVLVSLVVLFRHLEGSSAEKLVVTIVSSFVAIVTMIAVATSALVSERESSKRQKIIESIDTRDNVDGEEQHAELDFIDKLVKINFTYIESYYLQTQRQANKSFLLSAFAAVVALVVMTSGIVMMFNNVVSKGGIAAGVGAFSELIAAVFFYLYNRTVLKMSEYHQKLVLTQNIALALKISEKLPAKDERPKAQMRLIDALSKDINHYLSPTPEPHPPLRKKKLGRRKVKPSADGAAKAEDRG